ncbi:MAG: homocysteine S-methyltransferase family protein [Bacillota bacterium]|nr:homocysteine S-methyltransferase family protein [Bacillota bacterium]
MILLDGSFGTCLWGKAEEKGIEKTPVWMYNKTQPEMVEALCMEYFNAGTQIIQTNTFSANPETLERFGWDLKENIKDAVEIARSARKSFLENNPAKAGTDGIKISLDIGPLPRFLDPIGNMTEKEAGDAFTQIIDAGISAGVDLIFLETFQDLNLMKIGADVAMKSLKPTFTSFSYDERCRTLCGDTPEEIARTMAELGVDVLGINCSFGPVAALPVLDQYKSALNDLGSDIKLLFKPNVDENMTPEEFANDCKPAFDKASYIGSCCGSSPKFIKALKNLDSDCFSRQ